VDVSGSTPAPSGSMGSSTRYLSTRPVVLTVPSSSCATQSRLVEGTVRPSAMAPGQLGEVAVADVQVTPAVERTMTWAVVVFESIGATVSPSYGTLSSASF